MFRKRTREIRRWTTEETDFYTVEKIKTSRERPIVVYLMAILHFGVTFGILCMMALDWGYGVDFTQLVAPGTLGGYAFQAIIYSWIGVGIIAIGGADGIEIREQRKLREDANPVHAFGI